MRGHADGSVYHIEILTPKQSSEALEDELAKFAAKYNTVIGAGYAASIPDNPMGHLSFQATEIIPELGLEVKPDQLMIHLNTFHTRQDLDGILGKAREMGVKYLLVVSGDGGERLPKLTPEALGLSVNAVTAVELLRHIRTAYPGVFHCGVAFNPYEPQDHEIEKMRRKVEAGAEFVVTQPLIGRDERVFALKPFGLPVIVNAWMSKKLHLLSECVGYPIPESSPYDPIENLKALRASYPECGLYLALVGYKTQFPLLNDIWRTPA